MKKISFYLISAAVLLTGCAQREAEVRNVIYMIGDGMGLSHVSQMMIEQGYEPSAFDRMQNVALITTYSANNRVTDSAAAGTALATGCKTDNSMLGMLPDSTCVYSIMTRAAAKGYATGEVVTCKIQHATPGAFYAHVPDRDMYDEISEQFVESGIDVAFGGGLAEFDRVREDGTTLRAALEAKGYDVVTDFAATADISSGRVVGLFAEGHMPSMLDGRGDYLAPATAKALEILSADSADRDKGFVLMVEGSQIDWESHGNNAEGILAETRDFERAVAEAMRFADTHPGTLVVVTADHETGGMSLVSGDPDFRLSEQGLAYRFGTGGHSGIMVPVYLYGTGAESINGIMDNTALSRSIAGMLGLNE